MNQFGKGEVSKKEQRNDDMQFVDKRGACDRGNFWLQFNDAA